ncbi:MAG: hypothetical protein P1V51_13395 [Deltaproteobacteria bacterium]|nr:hypothetical protein [Deltaproteobacteria bacterium]
MKNYFSNQPVPRGVYFNLNPIDLQFVSSDDEILEGEPGANYVRIPTFLALLGSPLLGVAFVILFPVLIFASIAVLAAQALSKKAGEAVREQAPLLRMQGAPVASYLQRENEGEEGSDRDELSDLETEVDAARAEEEADKQ